MPNCFQLIQKSSGKPEKFAEIDDKLCEFLGVQPSPTKYYRGWYDSLGMLAASGRTWSQILEIYAEEIENDDPELGRIIQWFDENYTTNAWYVH